VRHVTVVLASEHAPAPAEIAAVVDISTNVKVWTREPPSRVVCGKTVVCGRTVVWAAHAAHAKRNARTSILVFIRISCTPILDRW
jgi:hypothetical protein